MINKDQDKLDRLILIEQMSQYSSKYNSGDKLSVENFEEIYPDISDFVKKIEKIKNKHAVILAKVKSGKRKIKELLAIRSFPKVKHFYLSAWNRRDEQSQLDELELYEISVHVIKKSGDMNLLLHEVQKAIDDGYDVVIHFNESDYGTRDKQLISEGFNSLLEKNVKFIFYSATNEELCFSKLVKDCVELNFEPSSNYRGDKWFLDNNLVYEAMPFWDFSNNALTFQGVEILNRFLSRDDKIFGCVRFSNGYNEIKQNTKFISTIKKDFNIEIKFVDEDESFDWSKGWMSYALRWISQPNFKVLFVICQTCSRSTEIGFHKFLAFWHDYRNKNTPYTTIIQADQRPNHYYDGISENFIEIYSCKTSWEYSAGLIDEKTYLENSDRDLSSRVEFDRQDRRKSHCSVVLDINLNPTDDQIFDEIIKYNPKFDKKQYKIRNMYCQTNLKADVAEAALNKTYRANVSDTKMDVVCCYYLDGPSPNHIESWENIKNKNLERKIVVIFPDDNININTKVKVKNSIYNIL